MWHRDPDTRLVEPGDRAFWQGIWRTEAMRTAFDDPATGYGAVLERVIARPWWFVTQRHAGEAQHFSVWFAQTLIRRTYANPLLEDLALFHELLHGITFQDRPAGTEAQWRLRMRANEIAVSLETEVLIYARLPHLRAMTFDHPIWADRLDLRPGPPRSPWPDPRTAAYLDAQARWSLSPLAIAERELRWAVPSQREWPLPFPATIEFPYFDRLWAARRSLTLAPTADPVEQTIARYEHQAPAFYDAWAPYWRQVEQSRVDFEARCDRGDWGEACAVREREWEALSDARGVPYGQLIPA
jgi:hypothetical protein